MDADGPVWPGAPPVTTASPARLVILMHGRGANGEDLDIRELG